MNLLRHKSMLKGFFLLSRSLAVFLSPSLWCTTLSPDSFALPQNYRTKEREREIKEKRETSKISASFVNIHSFNSFAISVADILYRESRVKLCARLCDQIVFRLSIVFFCSKVKFDARLARLISFLKLLTCFYFWSWV